MATVNELAVFTQDMTVRYYEQDFMARLRPCDVFNWFQEMAGGHCRVHGTAIEDIAPRGFTWVLHRAKIIVGTMPSYGDTCSISSWAHPRMDKFSVREFLVQGRDGARMIAGSEQWVAIDLATKRPVNLSKVRPYFPANEERAVEGDLKPILIPPGLPVLGSTEVAATPWCLDSNKHVNNSVYVMWMYDNIFPHISHTPFLRELEVNYRKEVALGERLTCECFRAPDGAYYSELTQLDSGAKVAAIRSVWSRKP